VALQRSGDARDDCLIGCPLLNSGKAVAYGGLVTGYTLFVTSQYDVIFTFANKRFGQVC